ncbi:MAG: thioredoxin family protein, partial [Nitriliruptoraceae bacterium]
RDRVREVASTEHLDAVEFADVGLELGDTPAGAVLLSSPGCAPCVQVRRVLTELGRRHPGFCWVEVAAADHLALTERLSVRRVPTVLVVDRAGRLLARAGGVPSLDALGEVVATAGGTEHVLPFR